MSIKQRYLSVALVLVASACLSLFLRLDFNNASLLLKELRLPRLMLGLAVGGALSLGGLIMQTVLSNPLAEPYTLGVASGAALGAAIGSSFGLGMQMQGLNLGAVAGALLTILILFRVGGRENRDQGSFILMGVMLSLTSASLLAIWMALADPVGVQSINFWLLGDLSRVGLGSAILLLIFTLSATLYFWMSSRKLDAFLFGSDMVESFGVSLKSNRTLFILLASSLVGFCVGAAGVIGFVGLIVPHLVRRWLGSSRHFHLIPLTVMAGSAILVLSDTLAHAIANPHELPVGAITAVIGAPIFIFFFGRKLRGSPT